MKKRLIAFSVIALALAATAVYGTQGESESALGYEERPAQKKQRAPSGAATAQMLERESKIPPGSYKAVGPKAYEIARANDFRPPGDALLHVKNLIERSKSGDASATYEIHLTIGQCQTFTSDRLDTLMESAASVGSEGWFLERSERIIKECGTLVLDQDIYHADWLSKAAAMGSQEAMRAYSLSPEKIVGSLDDAIRDPEKLEQWRETAMSYTHELATQGNVDAIGDLAHEYTYGGFVPADPVTALAYTRVLNRLDPRFATTTDIASHENKLSNQDRERARLLSNNIFTNCCVAR